MEAIKPWFKSTGVWGNVIAMVATGAGIAGFTMTPEDQMTATKLATNGVELVTGAIAFSGELMGLIGRLRASKKIG